MTMARIVKNRLGLKLNLRMKDEDRDVNVDDALIRDEANVVAHQGRSEEVFEKGHLLPKVCHRMNPYLFGIIIYVWLRQAFSYSNYCHL